MKKLIMTAFTILLALSLVACNSEPEERLVLLNDEDITVEFGADLDLTLEKYLDTSELSEEELAEVTIKLVTPKMDANGNVKADSKEVDPTNLGFGTKAILIELNGEQKTINILVKDTVAPEFTKSKDSYTIEEGEDLPNIKKDFEATDLTEVTISVDTKEVKTDKPGKYKATVKATDTSGNETTKEVTITVEEKPEPEISTPSYSGGSTTTSRPSGGGSSSSKPSSGSSGGSSSGGGSSSKPSQETCTPYVGNSGMLFDSNEEAWAWADNYIQNQEFPWKYHGYSGGSAGCGKVTIDFY